LCRVRRSIRSPLQIPQPIVKIAYIGPHPGDILGEDSEPACTGLRDRWRIWRISDGTRLRYLILLVKHAVIPTSPGDLCQVGVPGEFRRSSISDRKTHCALLFGRE